jgi:hypothetical protein
MTQKNYKTSDEKIRIYQNLFTGLTNAYGTYDPATGRSWQVRKPVTYNTILEHLKGKKPYGIYLLDGDNTKAIAVDFDDKDPFPPIEFINSARHYQIPAYIETSKSKGFHVWIFFNNNGVKAFKARLVVKNILEEIEHPQTEIFPKQDFLDITTSFGNFINAPLFGELVPFGKTVFIDPHTLKSYPNQWKLLESIKHVKQQVLDEIIELNDLNAKHIKPKKTPPNSANGNINRFGLLRCAQRMLQEGVTQHQRVNCFR